MRIVLRLIPIEIHLAEYELANLRAPEYAPAHAYFFRSIEYDVSGYRFASRRAHG
jgi:hypothetical protein